MIENRNHRLHSRRLSQLSTLTAVIITCVLLIAFQFVNGRQQMLEELHTEATIIAANSAAALAFNDAKAAGEILAALRLTPRIVGGALYRADGSLLAAEKDAAGLFPANIDAAGPNEGVTDRMRSFGLIDVILEDVVQQETRVGALVLRVSYGALYLRMFEYVITLLIIGAIALLLTFRFTSGLRRKVVLADEQLEEMALYDQTTGLPNRRFFEAELRKSILLARREQKIAALLFIDVDNFKKVNDLCGHFAGDQVLRLIGERLRKTVRSADVIARIGGDEFVVILYGIGSPDKAAKIATEMIATLTVPFPTEPIPSHVGLSIGIAMMPNDSDDAETLLRWADMAMYEAKALGKNRYHFFSEAINEKVSNDLQVESDLRAALKDPQGGLWLAYQPQVYAATGRLAGVEALIRWHRNDGRSIGPDEFIPIAEKSGLIADVGRWVIARACEDLKVLHGRGITLPKVAINLSPRELTQGKTLVEGICQTLEAYGESRATFQIELTESALMNASGSAVLEALHSAGFSLAIDDFGSGYSSLGYLKRFSVSTLKIDRQFVQFLPEDAENAAIVAAVIHLSKALGVVVVAEGVETAAQAEFLSTLDCDILQGYFISRPIPPEALASFVCQSEAAEQRWSSKQSKAT
jgi:diguanylate cyclase (GGDEF)-like protein